MSFVLSLLLAAAFQGDTAAAPPRDLRREQARVWAHEGLPPGADYASLLADAEQSRDALLASLIAAAALVPERVSDRPSLTGEDKVAAVDRILEELLRGADSVDHELLFERLRGQLSAEQLQETTTALLDGLVEHRLRGVSLILASPFREARPQLLRLLHGQDTAPGERERIAERLLAGGGRPALVQLDEFLLPDAPDGVLRRLLGVWQSMVELGDHGRLALLAREAEPTVAQLALQVWAQYAIDAAAKAEIFELSRLLPSSARVATLHYLGRSGGDPVIAAQLVAALDSPRREEQRVALQALPAFLDADALYEEFRKRVGPEEIPQRRGRWMVELARLPNPDAQALAAEWLVSGGWAEGSLANQVMRHLRSSPAIDPLLDRLLFLEEAPDRIVFPLAVARASESEAARSYLREVLEAASGIQQQQAVEAIAKAGHAADLPVLLAVAQEAQFDSVARVRAIEALARKPQAQALLCDMLREEELDYEVVEGMLRALVRHGEPHIRREMLAFARAGAHRLRGDERLGARLAAWQAQTSSPRPAERQALAGELLEELGSASAAHPGSGEALSDPRRMTVEYPSVFASARALAASVRAAGELGEAAGAVLDAAQPVEYAPGPLLLAGAQLAKQAPEVAAAWSLHVVGRSELHASTRLRALAARVRACRFLEPERAAAAWHDLRRAGSALREYPWEIGFGLNDPAARGWVVPGDRLAERELLARAEAAAGVERVALLAPLATGYCAPGNLVTAAQLCLEAPDGSRAAMALSRAATEWAPLEIRTWQILARAAGAAGDRDEARRAWLHVQWLAPRASALEARAREAIGELGSGQEPTK